jgi:hypothetical protein
MSNESTESVVETAIAVSTPNAVTTNVIAGSTPNHSSNDHFSLSTTLLGVGSMVGDALNDTINGIALTDVVATPSSSLSLPVGDTTPMPSSTLRLANRIVVATCEEEESCPQYKDIINDNIKMMSPPDNNAIAIDSIIDLYTPSSDLLCYVAQFFWCIFLPSFPRNLHPFIIIGK